MTTKRDWSLDGLVLSGLGREIERDGKKERPLDAFRVRQGEGGERDVLTGMGAVNVFVGANNSGKSRFMRELMEMKEWNVDAELGDDRRFLAAILRAMPFVASPQADPVRLQDSVERLGMVRNVQASHQVRRGGRTIALVEGLENLVALEPLYKPIPTDGYLKRAIPEAMTKAGEGPIESLPERSAGAVAHAVELACTAALLKTRVYYPVLRTLRPLVPDDPGSKDSDRYRDLLGIRFQAEYSLSARRVHSGMGTYDAVKRNLLGKRPERDRIRGYEQFLSREFFSGQQITLTPHGDDGVLHIEIAEVERPIHELGDGLQSIIMLTLTPFLMREAGERGAFFIEEPELYLHPGMQRKLLDFYIHDTSHLYFMTTHSNHLLDMSADWPEMAVFNFQKKARASDNTGTGEQFLITPVDRGDESSLQLLGVRASSVFLVNATVWVEGVTDRLYVRQMLRMLEKHLCDTNKLAQRMEEDTHYSFVEYGGANITHWSFLSREEHPILVDRLCGHAILLADNDDDGRKKAERRKALKAALQGHYLETAGREIENMLPACAVQAALRDLGESAARVDAVTLKEYRRKKIGFYLDGLPDPGSRIYADRYGTLKDKTDFCHRAIEALSTLEFTDLDPEVRTIILTIYNFIREKNDLSPISLA